MDYRITQCPRCGTSFRVTDAHLAIAAGAVRCGSCLHIFNAREHWAEEQAADELSAEEAAQEQVLRDDEALEQQVQAANRDDTPLADDSEELRFGDDSDDDQLFSDDPSEQASNLFSSADDHLLFLDGGGDDRPAPAISSDSGLSPDFLEATGWSPDPRTEFDSHVDDDDEHDDSWAEQLLSDSDSDVDNNSSNSDDERREPTSADPLLDEFDDILANTPLADDSEVDDSAPQQDDNWQLGDNDYAVRPAAADQELQLSAEFLSLGELDRSASGDSTGIADGSNLSPEWQRVLGSDGEPGAVGDDTLRADDRIGEEGHGRGRQLLGSFEPEPLQLHRFVREPRWPKLLWGLGLVAGVVLLIGQYVYFNFPTLARGDSRPLMAQLCGVVGCTLPSQSDLSAIRTSSLIVRSHPTRRGALAVDAILTNSASFRQPYPDLLLQFTDLNGEPVAGALFKAADYLGGELAGDALMPVQQPVHIGLVIADPGNRAVNYQLLVSTPQTP